MKRFSLVHMLVILVMVVTVASCGMTQPLYEDGYEGRTSRRVYADPYYGGQTVLVRDPYTRQIYEAPLVTPYGGYGYPNTYPSGRHYGNGGYGRGYSRNYPRTNQNRGSYNNNNNSNNGSSNSNNNGQKGSQKIDRAKDIINGRN